MIIIIIMHNNYKGDDYFEVRQNIVILQSTLLTDTCKTDTQSWSLPFFTPFT